MRKLTTKEFISKAKTIHGGRCTYNKVNYVNNSTKITVICNEHGEFVTTPANHLTTFGCRMCRYKSVSESLKSRQSNYINNVLGGIIYKDDYIMIPYKKGKHFIIDKEDYDKIKMYNWYQIGNYIGTTYQNNNITTTVLLHRFIMNVDNNLQVDHINHDEKDNRKNNLRVCTQKQNLLNSRPRKHTSKYKGVSLCSKTKRWRAYITLNGKFKQLGVFNNEEDAARAYDEKAKELFGEFAYLNFPSDN